MKAFQRNGKARKKNVLEAHHHDGKHRHDGKHHHDGKPRKKQEAEKLEWQRRGVSGTITAVNPDTKEVTVSARVRGESKPVVIEASDKAQFRRYSPDSIRFSDAKPS